jgi:UDP-N-acetylglucosamine--N-acetylmuramyl-(pentapeptide) pyrophosphoryl-undecaprenol N-acetylglucosamine transferase
VAKNGAAIVVEEKDLSASVLAGLVIDLEFDQNRLQQMAEASKALSKPDAAGEIVRIAEELAGVGQEGKVS